MVRMAGQMEQVLVGKKVRLDGKVFNVGEEGKVEKREVRR